MLTNLFFSSFLRIYFDNRRRKDLPFIRQEQLNDAAREYLGDHVEIRPYDSFFDYLTKEDLLEL